jgi:hypothetical protein
VSDAQYRIDPALPLTWETFTTLRIGFERPVATVSDPSAGAQRLIGAFRSGLPLAPDHRRLRRYGVTPAEWREVVAALAPVLVEAAPEPGPERQGREGGPPQGRLRRLRVAVTGAGLAQERIGEALTRVGHRVHRPPPEQAGRTEPELDLLIHVERFIEAPGPDILLLAERLPQLTLRFTDRAFWLGPLSAPRGSPCARCVVEHELDADPALPLIAAQILGRTPAAETPLAVAAAADLAVTAIRRWQHGDAALARSRVRVAVARGLPSLAAVPSPVAAHPRCRCGAATLGGVGPTDRRRCSAADPGLGEEP